jgi:hypothetical protein
MNSRDHHTSHLTSSTLAPPAGSSHLPSPTRPLLPAAARPSWPLCGLQLGGTLSSATDPQLWMFTNQTSQMQVLRTTGILSLQLTVDRSSRSILVQPSPCLPPHGPLPDLANEAIQHLSFKCRPQQASSRIRNPGLLRRRL